MFGLLKDKGQVRVYSVGNVKKEHLMIPTHASYSSINLFLKNPSAWHSKYVLGIRDQSTNPAALVGTAFHKYMELKFRGATEDICRESAEAVIKNCLDVDWGKTGSIEKSLMELNSLIVWVNRELPYQLSFLEAVKILGLEQCIECKVPGIKLPLKAYVDMVFEDDKGIHLIDWKTKRSYNTSVTPAYKLQATVYYLQAKKKYGKSPKSMKFIEIKTSKNADSSPQIKPLIYDYTDPEVQREMKAIKHLINQVMKKMTAKRKNYLPNISDEFEGEKEFNRYVTNFHEYDRQLVQNA